MCYIQTSCKIQKLNEFVNHLLTDLALQIINNNYTKQHGYRTLNIYICNTDYWYQKHTFINFIIFCN